MKKTKGFKNSLNDSTAIFEISRLLKLNVVGWYCYVVENNFTSKI